MARMSMFLFLAAFSGLLAEPAIADTQAVQTDACAGARDRDLHALAAEAIAIANALDTDAAVADAPEYELQEAGNALMADIERARREVHDRYRRCVAGDVDEK